MRPGGREPEFLMCAGAKPNFFVLGKCALFFFFFFSSQCFHLKFHLLLSNTRGNEFFGQKQIQSEHQVQWLRCKNTMLHSQGCYTHFHFYASQNEHRQHSTPKLAWDVVAADTMHWFSPNLIASILAHSSFLFWFASVIKGTCRG